MTVATETWYTGYNPYTLEPVFSAKSPREKLAQRQYFFWYKPEERRNIEMSLRRIGRADLIAKLYSGERRTTTDWKKPQDQKRQKPQDQKRQTSQAQKRRGRH